MEMRDFNIRGNRVYFIGSFLSNWYPSEFTENDWSTHNTEYWLGTFNCVEQWMMAHKAILFDDKESFNNIVMSTNPAYQKRCGRNVKNYDESKWESQREAIVKEGIRLKFEQNNDLYNEFLMFPTGTEFVECNSADKIWGIGLGMNNPDIFNKRLWQGKNLLGEILSELRVEFA